MSQISASLVHAALAQIRPKLLGFARLQLRSDAVAEDVVQDTLVAAMEGADKFAGASAFQTWVFGILKYKIIDEMRRNQRVQADVDAETALDEAVLGLFDAKEHWAAMPVAWGDPHACLEQQRFWDVLDACLTQLPPNSARVFAMREFLELDTESICKELAISPSNCWVLLHRARLGLRECLGIKWFGGAQS